MEVRDIILCSLTRSKHKPHFIEYLKSQEHLSEEDILSGIQELVEEGIIVRDIVDNCLIPVEEEPQLARKILESNAKVKKYLEILSSLTSTSWELLDFEKSEDVFTRGLQGFDYDAMCFHTALDLPENAYLHIRAVMSDVSEVAYCECVLERRWEEDSPLDGSFELPLAAIKGFDLLRVIISCMKKSRLFLAKTASDIPSSDVKKKD